MEQIIISGWLGYQEIDSLKNLNSGEYQIIIDEDNPLLIYVKTIINELWFSFTIWKVNKELAGILSEAKNVEWVKNKTKLNLMSCAYESSIMYMIYWYKRLLHKPQELLIIKNSLQQYLWVSDKYIDVLLNDESLSSKSIEFVEHQMVAQKTVDIVLYRENNWVKEIWTIARTRFPIWNALPWWFIHDEDETNNLWVLDYIFSALRVWWEKILWEKSLIYGKDKDQNDKEYYYVSSINKHKKLKLYLDDTRWYHYKDYLERIIFPSDPRHIVDTVWFEMEYEWPELENINRTSKDNIMNPANNKWWFIFNHHREIVAHLSSRTSLEKERDFNHSQRVRDIIENPEKNYYFIKDRFIANNNNPETSMPELFPVVDKIKKSLFSEKINELCKNDMTLLARRDNVDNSLTHVSFKNRVFCPYESTLRAIYDWIKFYDVVARKSKEYYNHCTTQWPIQHNPKNTENALYHTYRYEYRYNEMLWMIPNEILIPTFEYLWATDIMKIRWVPIRFVWLSEDFIYVDEFIQSPKEFFMHDVNHSYRMAIEDIQFAKKLWLSMEELYKKSNKFLHEYLQSIKVSKSDTKEQKEIKKLKKIILFEIIHEDARPCLPEIIWEYLQQVEGNAVPFEVPTIKDDWYREVTDLIDIWISTLSYVRNKLQYWFYDEVDSQIPQIVDPDYRFAKWIARAAYEMLIELNAISSEKAELDEKWNVSIDRLMYRICAVWPDNIHNAKYPDPDMEKYWDGAKLLNPKRYQLE